MIFYAIILVFRARFLSKNVPNLKSSYGVPGFGSSKSTVT